MQFTAGGGSHLLWPRWCEGWGLKDLDKLRSTLNMKTVHFDGCMLGVKSLKSDVPIMKPWRVDTTNAAMIDTMSRFRCDLSHEHTPCAGQDTVLTGFYPTKTAEIIVQTIVEDCANSITQVTLVADLTDSCSSEGVQQNINGKSCLVSEHPSHNDGYESDGNAVGQGGFPVPDRRTSAKAVRARQIQMDRDIEDCLKVLTQLRLTSASVAKQRNTKTGSSMFASDDEPKHAMPCLSNNQHREKNTSPLFNAMVATAIKDWKTNPAAFDALQTEYEKLLTAGVWDKEAVEWSDVSREARERNEIIHLGRVFAILTTKK